MKKVSLRTGLMMKHDLELNSELYEADALTRAIKDYSKLAHIKIWKDNGYYLLTFSHCQHDKTTTINEFCNYVIDLQNCME